VWRTLSLQLDVIWGSNTKHWREIYDTGRVKLYMRMDTQRNVCSTVVLRFIRLQTSHFWQTDSVVWIHNTFNILYIAKHTTEPRLYTFHIRVTLCMLYAFIFENWSQLGCSAVATGIWLLFEESNCLYIYSGSSSTRGVWRHYYPSKCQ